MTPVAMTANRCIETQNWL